PPRVKDAPGPGAHVRKRIARRDQRHLRVHRQLHLAADDLRRREAFLLVRIIWEDRAIAALEAEFADGRREALQLRGPATELWWPGRLVSGSRRHSRIGLAVEHQVEVEAEHPGLAGLRPDRQIAAPTQKLVADTGPEHVDRVADDVRRNRKVQAVCRNLVARV